MVTAIRNGLNQQRSQLEPLPYPVYFVNKDEKWQDLVQRDGLPGDVESLYEQCASATDIWSIQTYIHLKQRGLNVHLTSRYLPGKICVAPYYNIAAKDFAFNSYVVGVRHDCPRPKMCEQQIVLNEQLVTESTDHFMAHWPHPLLTLRDRTRGAKVENLVFKGRLLNLAESFRAPDFLEQLRSIDVNLVTDLEDQKSSMRDWGDYSQADVVLAVRDATEYDLALKPALKLINAWFAGCPAILGPEPAYQALRKSELDYIEVRSPEEAIAALARLQQNPALYAAMVQNGLERAQAFTADRLAMQWRELLAGPIADGYREWRRQSSLAKYAGRPMQYFKRVKHHKQEYNYYRFQICNGIRPLRASQELYGAPSAPSN